MTVPVVDCVDTIHADVSKVPTSEIDVEGYVTGTSDIDWAASDWARFPNSRRIRIWQGYGAEPPLDGFEVIDIESGAVTPQQAADMVERRVLAGIQWTLLYGGDTALAQTAVRIQAKGQHIWDGHVLAWFADWNLNRQGAADLIGAYIHGMTVVGVQYASPTSNPDTILPGSTLTLAQSNCDLSVVNAGYVPNSTPGPTPVPVPPPANKPVWGVVIALDTGLAHNVWTVDGGAHWTPR